MTKTATIAAIKAIDPRLTVRCSEGEYRVSFAIPAIQAQGVHVSYNDARNYNEDVAYYTDDSEDAIATAKSMVERF